MTFENTFIGLFKQAMSKRLHLKDNYNTNLPISETVIVSFGTHSLSIGIYGVLE